MSEEPRFFIRIALYVIIAGTIYWFVSYEDAGTALFGFLAAGCLFFAASAVRMIRPRRSGRHVSKSVLTALQQTIGFADLPDDERRGPLDVEPEALPAASTWPLLGAASALLLGLGLLYGAWFWLPGLGLAISAAWGWTTELTR